MVFAVLVVPITSAFSPVYHPVACLGRRMSQGQSGTGPIGKGLQVRLIRFRSVSQNGIAQEGPRVGVLHEDGAPGNGTGPALVTTLPGEPALADLLSLPVRELQDLLGAPGGERVPLDGVELLAPIDGRTEVWAAGVTYERSRDARIDESEDSADVYDRVYTAERPELFFKSVSWRVRGPGRAVSVRADSSVDVPEPELAAVLNYAGEVAGYTICNDMSSRSIEGQNPLYLPQAKIYLGGCAVGPWIRPAWEIPDPYDLAMELIITRDGQIAWQGESSTSGLRRRVPELASYLFREDDFPAGAILSTGTSLVPDLPFTLQPADQITIRVDGIGELSNPVVRGKNALVAAGIKRI
jgi:2-dehydro-3-deoxy-D-arabinonate dehydratase